MAGASRNPARAFRPTTPSNGPSSRSDLQRVGITPTRPLVLFPVDHLPAHSPIGDHVLAGDEARRRTQQKGHQLAYVFRLPYPTDRVLFMVDLPQRVTVLNCVRARIYPAGADRIDPDIRTETHRHGVGERHQAALAGRVGLGVDLRLDRAGRGDV